MLLALVLAQFVVALALPAVAVRNLRAAFGVAALLPAVAFGWAIANAPAALTGGVTESVSWAPVLGLAFDVRLDALGLVMVVLVSGLGALILVYSAWYFAPTSGDGRRSAPLLLFFAGAMLGLVLADDLLTLYVFWELTSIASFLLVGQDGARRENRRAAVQALLVTVFGGLAMLLGFVIVGEAAGTYRISEIVAAPPAGGAVTAALVLILLGVLTKSAQAPFHPWLPAAMAAPTPVSAYLHAASMVKAGVFLVARLSPAFAGLAVWWVPVVTLGLVTMLIGGYRALGATDLKRLLAFGTVSQLGFLMVLFGAGGRVAAVAGAALLLAHGLFKAALFLVVGTIDKVTGTREVAQLSGLAGRLPSLLVASVLAAASMAGVPPLIGFVAKEAAFEAFLDDGGVRGWVVAVVLLVGSVFTVGYSARFLWGAFARKPGVDPTPCARPAAGLTVPIWLCAAAGLVFGFAVPVVDRLATRYGEAYPGEEYHLALWHGLTLPLLFSVIAIAAGLMLHARRDTVAALAARLHGPLSAQRGYEHVVGGLERAAVFVTGRLQVGSLPVYLAFVLLTVLALPGTALLLAGAWPDDVPVVHQWMQLPLGLLVSVAALAVVRAHRRFTAVLLVGAVGYGIGGLFVIDGAPDLALAQFLVETLTLVAFVFVLRRLPAHFDEPERRRRPRRRPDARLPKAVLAGAGGITIAALGLVLSGARTAPPSTSEQMIADAPQTGATNVISAILVDFRALDTVGEITVLLVAAAGTASLVFATRYDRRRKGRTVSGSGTPEHEEEVLG